MTAFRVGDSVILREEELVRWRNENNLWYIDSFGSYEAALSTSMRVVSVHLPTSQTDRLNLGRSDRLSLELKLDGCTKLLVLSSNSVTHLDPTAIEKNRHAAVIRKIKYLNDRFKARPNAINC